MFYLLSHERELLRQDSTSSLLLSSDECCSKRVVWQRTEAERVEELLPSPSESVLIYPSDECADYEIYGSVDNYILLDGTWQEARKIYNRSPYLKKFRSVRLTGVKRSEYLLRRNQKDGGLCTVEVVIEIMRREGKCIAADNLYQKFIEFQTLREKNILKR